LPADFHLLHTGCLIFLFFDPEDGSNMLPENVGENGVAFLNTALFFPCLNAVKIYVDNGCPGNNVKQ
jgi:hypothetical protein